MGFAKLSKWKEVKARSDETFSLDKAHLWPERSNGRFLGRPVLKVLGMQLRCGSFDMAVHGRDPEC